MTVWDEIYKKYQKGGEAWATLSEDISPFFRNCIDENSFHSKHVLDIGCGTRKYLKYLQKLNFKTDGIDSSATAVEMTKQIVNDNSHISNVNMFEYDIPRNKYDLIISISTIHHGTKSQVYALINKIWYALLENGKVCITLPDFDSAKKRNAFIDHEMIEHGTYAPLSGPEKGLPHSFYTKNEIEDMFSQFSNVMVKLDDIGRWFIMALK